MHLPVLIRLIVRRSYALQPLFRWFCVANKRRSQIRTTPLASILHILLNYEWRWLQSAVHAASICARGQNKTSQFIGFNEMKPSVYKLRLYPIGSTVADHMGSPFCRWQIPGPLLEKSRKFPFRIRPRLTTYLQANTFIIARKWLKLTHFYQLHKTH